MLSHCHCERPVLDSVEPAPASLTLARAAGRGSDGGEESEAISPVARGDCFVGKDHLLATLAPPARAGVTG
jgi:hypothetical protein